MKKNLEFISKLLFIIGILGTVYSFVIGEKMVTNYCIGIMALGFVSIAYFYDIFSIKNLTINDLCSFLIFLGYSIVPFNNVFGFVIFIGGHILFYSQKLFNPNKKLRYSELLIMGL